MNGNAIDGFSQDTASLWDQVVLPQDERLLDQVTASGQIQTTSSVLLLVKLQS